MEWPAWSGYGVASSAKRLGYVTMLGTLRGAACVPAHHEAASLPCMHPHWRASLSRSPRGPAQAVSNSLWAYAKLGYNPGRELLDCTARRAGGMLHQYTSQARPVTESPGPCVGLFQV